MNGAAPESFHDGRVTLYAGDCLSTLDQLDENSVDGCCTDPPYHLTSIVKRFGSGNAAPVKPGKTGAYSRASAGFMGKTWDGGDIAFRPETWAKVFRVLKPGAYLVAFGGTRGWHRMVCAIEDAGFEIRDTISHLTDGGLSGPLMWTYGSGFPKSHNISKAIDKVGGLSPREQAAILRAAREARKMTRDDLAKAIGCTVSSVRDWEEGRSRTSGSPVEWLIPSDKYRRKIADLLGYTRDCRRWIGLSVDRRSDDTIYGLGHTGNISEGGLTDAARRYEGYGTALKPSFEPICVARKPLDGTIAENVLRWGTGALRIDDCRVGTSKNVPASPSRNGQWFGVNGEKGVESGHDATVGRWPPNLCHDGSPEVLALFPESAGQNGAVTGLEPSSNRKHLLTGLRGGERREPRNDCGSAARFFPSFPLTEADCAFYSAKAGSDDRLGSKHATVKPLDLMRWLVRLHCPKGGLVIDPFAGTGTTGHAALIEGCRAILCEADPEHCDDIRRRMGLVYGSERERAQVSRPTRQSSDVYQDIFAPSSTAAE